ncbi:MAG: hypothetical protein HY801_06490 [Candidatus Lindowbacteria bacterium]|nr:hypothetical protein [Candidatus Lindowbacteria bacterium]
MLVESYIIHIYRRDEKVPTKILGTIEKVGEEKKRSFENFDELRALISSNKGDGLGEKIGP